MLKETKGRFKLIGKINRIDGDKAFNTGVAERGKHKGRKFRVLNMSVRTSKTNEVFVSMFDYEPKEVFLWNSEKRKEDPKYKGDRVAYNSWLKNEDKYKENGYVVLQSRIGLEFGEDGKVITHGVPKYVASQRLHAGLNNGDSVIVEGVINVSKYKDSRTDKMITRKNHSIERVIKLKNDLDFDKEDFEEITYFEQEIVHIDAEVDKKERKTYITGRVINYEGKFNDVQFVINLDGEDGEPDKDMEKLSNSFLKRVKFGDVLNIYGNTVNRAIISESDDSEDDDTMTLLGGKSKPNHAVGVTGYVNEMEIIGVDSWDKKVYTEEDFISDDGLTDSNNIDLGGKGKSTNPFDDSEDDDNPFDTDDDDDNPFK